jgi:hypothetical protein
LFLFLVVTSRMDYPIGTLLERWEVIEWHAFRARVIIIKKIFDKKKIISWHGRIALTQLKLSQHLMMLFWLRKCYVTSILILQLINFHIFFTPTSKSTESFFVTR